MLRKRKEKEEKGKDCFSRLPCVKKWITHWASGQQFQCRIGSDEIEENIPTMMHFEDFCMSTCTNAFVHLFCVLLHPLRQYLHTFLNSPTFRIFPGSFPGYSLVRCILHHCRVLYTCWKERMLHGSTERQVVSLPDCPNNPFLPSYKSAARPTSTSTSTSTLLYIRILHIDYYLTRSQQG